MSSNTYWVHPTIVTGAQTRPHGTPDRRLTTKVAPAGRTQSLNGITATHKPVMYNLIREHAGRLAPSALTAASADADFVTELLYNRTYSLLWEQGTRWIDARRYNRVGTGTAVRGGAPGSLALPIDRDGDVIHTQMLIPAGEYDARKLAVPCSL